MNSTLQAFKPLMYYWDGSNLAFASEIKALKELKQLNFEINPSSNKL